MINRLLKKFWIFFWSNPRLCVFLSLRKLGLLQKMPDKEYLKYQFKSTMGYSLDLENPQTFAEKLQWLKLYNYNPNHTSMADKFDAKKYVSEKTGGGYIIPTLGIYENVNDINFDVLPNQFVLKCTHDSGGIFICRNKNSLNIKKVKEQLNRRLKINYYFPNREYPYKNIKPRIIAEQYMSDNGTTELKDYKFYCFHGIPQFLYLSEGLDNHDTAKISYLSLDWKRLPFHRTDFKEFENLPQKPACFEDMIQLAKILADGAIFVRVDLYEINGQIYFSEFTFFPGGGFTQIEPKEYAYKIGDLIKLPEVCK